jgi:4-hydroxy-tetrahydrodipicolinate synthase
MQQNKGFIPVMLTPFKDNGEIDYDVLTRLTEMYLQTGAKGLFANCLSSEMFELAEDERIKAIKHVVKIVGGAVPIVATGTFGGPISQQAEFIKKVSDAGSDAVILITGLLADEKDSDDVFNERVFDLFNQTENIPLGFYECPVPYKRLISPGQLMQFVNTGRIIYHKDTCLDLDTIKEKLKAGKNHPNFGLYDAYMAHAVESLKAGSAGLSCIQGNYFPELIVWLCDNYANENMKTQVDAAQQFLIDQMDVMHNVYPITAKYWLAKRGLDITTFTRREVGTFSKAVARDIDQLFVDYQKLQTKIGLQVELN